TPDAPGKALKLRSAIIGRHAARRTATASSPSDFVWGISEALTIRKGVHKVVDAGYVGKVRPTAAPTTAPAPGNGGGSLPVTGAALGGLLGGGAALLAGGAAMVVITRRRRIAGATATAE
ncbi:MAG: hypothetical protein QOI35_4035, partial [Cryptosporangiaceae bacterium]|nr:hypothetical protein [Cryptosporangiaceae bacterium]